jgi:hypothetical protein
VTPGLILLPHLKAEQLNRTSGYYHDPVRPQTKGVECDDSNIYANATTVRKLIKISPVCGSLGEPPEPQGLDYKHDRSRGI